jgi:peptide-methionine (R)-S-oxide reductase
MVDNTPKDEAHWREKLTPEQYRILRESGTERAYTSPLNDEKRQGVFTCAGCGETLFSAESKFNSGCGWPSFTAPLSEGALEQSVDYDIGYERVEVHCAKCGGHMGHVFPDGPEPTGQRFCINGGSLDFKPTKGSKKTDND